MELRAKLTVVEPLPATDAEGMAPQDALTPRKAAGWRDMLWCEWFTHSRSLLYFLLGWLVAVWVLPLFAPPGWILAFGVVYAILMAPLCGGSDLIDGSEEFSFSLPATRSELFRVRLYFGLGTLVLFTALDVLALGLDLSQALARLYLDTGLLKPWRLRAPGVLAGLVFAFPLTIFCIAFMLAAVGRSRASVMSSWFWGSLVSLLLLRVGLQYEAWKWQLWNGWISCPLLVTVSLACVWWGHRAFCRKEIVPPLARMHLPAHWWLWLLIALAGAGIILFLLGSLVRDFPLVLGG